MGNTQHTKKKINAQLSSEISLNDQKLSIMRQTTKLIQEKADILQEIDKGKALQVQKTIGPKKNESDEFDNDETVKESPPASPNEIRSKKIIKKKHNFITKEYLRVEI